jgi:hypothetical protein
MQPGSDRAVFLSIQPAMRRDRALAFAVIGVSSVLFALAVPFARVPLTPIPALIASQQSALAINNLITAFLLFSQFALLRSMGDAASGERLSVHRGYRDRPRPDLPGPV